MHVSKKDDVKTNFCNHLFVQGSAYFVNVLLFSKIDSGNYFRYSHYLYNFSLESICRYSEIRALELREGRYYGQYDTQTPKLSRGRNILEGVPKRLFAAVTAEADYYCSTQRTARKTSFRLSYIVVRI